MQTMGYRLADGRYYLVREQKGSVQSIQQVMFGSGVYPIPIKEIKNIEQIYKELSQ